MYMNTDSVFNHGIRSGDGGRKEVGEQQCETERSMPRRAWPNHIRCDRGCAQVPTEVGYVPRRKADSKDHVSYSILLESCYNTQTPKPTLLGYLPIYIPPAYQDERQSHFALFETVT